VGLVIPDLLFLVSIIFIYKDNLKADIKIFNKNYISFKGLLEIVAGFLLILFVLAIYGNVIDIMGIKVATTSSFDELPIAYSLLKILFFSTIMEELLFKESIKGLVTDKNLFILVSAVIYVAINYVYGSIPSIPVCGIYVVIGLTSSFLYVRNKNNIIYISLVKLLYNMIPLTMLIAGVVK
jgi:hypothetical protein